MDYPLIRKGLRECWGVNVESFDQFMKSMFLPFVYDTKIGEMFHVFQ